MDGRGDRFLCFPNLSNSCRRLPRSRSETHFLYFLLAFISLLTVMLNSLVIISISHYRQLHTPTNALLLSLAVSDLLAGLLVMPSEGLRRLENCWLLGKHLCALSPLISYSLLSASLGHMVLLCVDRYLAINDPLLYAHRVTMNRVKLAIAACWLCALLYNGLILKDHLRQPDGHSVCHGDCVMVISHASGTVDLFVSFVGPCAVMFVLYFKVFVVAVSQVRRSRTPAAGPPVRRSEWKAARTLGVVVLVFLMCFCPYNYPSLAGENTSSGSPSYAVLSWIMMLNSCMNPLIYALFYRWFRNAARNILTFRVMQSDSREAKIF